MNTRLEPQVKQRRQTSTRPDRLLRPHGSPGRAAAATRPRGWKVLLPFLYLIASMVGLSGLVSSAAGILVQPWILSWAARLEGFSGAPDSAPPASIGWIVALSGALLIGGLAGLVREERRERERERLLAMAEQRTPAPASNEERSAA